MRRVTDLIRRRKTKEMLKRTPTRAAPRRWLGIGAFTGTLFIAVVLTWLHSTGWTSSFATQLKITAIQRTAAVGLVVGDVLLEGRVHTPRHAILRAVSVRRGDPILGVNPNRIAQRVMAISWVENVIVERRLPGTLFVKIVERRPMALWQTTGRVALIDAGGVVLTRHDLAKFSRLVTVVGGDAPSHTPELLSMISENPALARRVRFAVRVGSRRWNLRFDNGIDVSLPQRGTAAAWARLGRLEQKHGLLGHDIKAIDLRLPDRLIVRKKNHLMQNTNKRGKKT